MKKLVTVLAVAFFAVSVSAQTTPAAPAKDAKSTAPAKAPAKKDDKKAAAKKDDKKATAPAPAAK